MEKQDTSYTLAYYFLYPLLFTFGMWLVFWIESTFQMNFAKHGVYPKRLSGLQGIVFAPFIHSSFSHIFNNTIPLFVLLSMLFYHYKRVAWKVLFWGWIFTGLGTWLIGRESYHIGMSGVNYMLISFLFFSGVIIGYYRLIAVSLVIVFLYGGLIWLMFPLVEYISWEGHLSGFIIGLFLAYIYGKQLKTHYEKKKMVKHYPEDDAFLKHFDENGNFVEFKEENKENENLIENQNNNIQKKQLE